MSDRSIKAVQESGLSKLTPTNPDLKEDEADPERTLMEISIQFKDGVAEFTLNSLNAAKHYYGSGTFIAKGLPEAKFSSIRTGELVYKHK